MSDNVRPGHTRPLWPSGQSVSCCRSRCRARYCGAVSEQDPAGVDSRDRAGSGAGHDSRDRAGSGAGHDPRDIEAIRSLRARYFRCLDQQDWEGLSDVFAPEARIDVTSSTGGDRGRGLYEDRDQFVAMVAKLLRGAVTVHHGHTCEIEITGADSATGVWAMEDRIWFPEGSPVGVLWGSGWYEEDYERLDGHWRIVRMVLRRQRVEIDGNVVT